MITGFDHISDENCTVLILGTMPGAESLRMQQYYAYPKNQFWKIIAQITDTGFESLKDYEEKKIMLLKNHIALWDVLKNCERESSSDSKIRVPEANDFKELLFRLPKLRAICFNGKEAEKLFKKFVLINIQKEKFDFMVFPSTSPANTIKYEKKLEEWMQLKRLLIQSQNKQKI